MGRRRSSGSPGRRERGGGAGIPRGEGLQRSRSADGEGFLHQWTTEAGTEGRLDRHVADRTGLSRSRVAVLIAEGRVLVDGRPAKKSGAVAPGLVVKVTVPPPAPSDTEPEDIPWRSSSRTANWW